MPPRKRTNPAAKKAAPRKVTPASAASELATGGVVTTTEPALVGEQAGCVIPAAKARRCNVPRCRRDAETNGLCGGHYATQRGYAERSGGDQ